MPEGLRSARRARVLPKTVLKIRGHHHWVSRYHQHRLADKIDGLWTIHGLSAHLGVPREWFYHRMRSGFLREPDVIRKPPYGNYLMRDDIGLLEQLRAEVTQSRRLRRDVATGSLPPAGAPRLEDAEADTAPREPRAMTSRTNCTTDAKQTPKEARWVTTGTPPTTGDRTLSGWRQNRGDLPRPALCQKLAL